ncbi:MAG: glucosyl transferase [Bacteroidetes bacterium]|nr:glucosyl transferase [Bacteroidota bacterium]
MSKKIVVLLFVFIGLLQTCNTTEPPPPDEKITLTLILEDVSSIEAWVTLTTTNLQLPTSITLKQNDQTRSMIHLVNGDTLLYIDSLLPNQTYSFHTTIQQPNQAEVKSNVLNVTTMDTTSHDFTWQSWTFGEIGSSTLYDVAIIDENNIWAVGEIYMNDSLGNPDPNAYNAIHWDGNEWNLYRTMFYTICGQLSRTPYPASSIFAFSESDIWVGMLGSQVARLNGATQVATFCLPVSVRKLWGVDNQNIYAVGVNGQIAWYNGSVWTRIESGTELNIGDIWGVPDGTGDFYKYLAAVDAMLIINAGNNLQRINTEQGHSLSSVWGKTDRLIYTAGGSGLSLYKNYKWEKINRADVNTIYNVRGQGYNDVFGLSSTISLLHFNGFSWQFINTGTSNIYFRQDVKNDLIAAVGWQGDKAVITIIRRHN